MVDMKACSVCKVELPDDNFYRGTVKADGSYGLTGACKSCFQARAKAKRDPVKAKVSAHKAYLKRKDKHRAINARYHADNRDKHNEQMRRYYQENKDKEKVRVREYNDKHPDKLYARGVRRANAVSRQSPVWTQKEKIKEVYRMAKVWSRRLNTQMQVDHVVPLSGNEVSGLHCWENLQIVSADINRAKHRGHYPNGFVTLDLMNG